MRRWVVWVILAIFALIVIGIVVAIVMLGLLRSDVGSNDIELPPPSAGFILTCSAFGDGEPIPVEYTCDGEDISPPLAWGEPPAGTRSFALILDDPDAPVGNWTHWIVYQIPLTARSFTPDLRPSSQIDGTVLLFGRNSWGKQTYGGPCPPSGTHHYFFRLYALGTVLDLPDNAKRSELENAMEGHIIGYAELMGTFQK